MQFLYQFGIFVLVILIVLKLCRLTNNKIVKTRAYSNLTSYGTTDRICRIIQYAASAYIGNVDRRFIRVISYFHINHLQFMVQLQRLATLMSHARKGIRFMKGSIILYRFTHHKQSFIPNSKIWSIKWFQQILWILGDITDLIFYFTDHFYAFYQLKIVHQGQLNADLEFVGNVMWILNGLLLFLAYLLELIQVNKLQLSQDDKKGKAHICYLGMISNFFQFILGFCFIYPDLMSRISISSMTIISSVAILMQFRYK